MKMNEEYLDNFDATIWWTLNQIYEQTILQHLSNGLASIIFDVEKLRNKGSNPPSLNDIRYAIIAMEKSWNILKIISPCKRDESGFIKPEKYLSRATCFILSINPDEFDEFYEIYKKNYKDSMTVNLTIYKNGTVDLKADGVVHRTEFRKGGGYYKVLILLARHKDVKLSFSEIAKVMKDDTKVRGDERRARDAIKYITDKLKYKNNDFILSDYGFTLVCDVEYKSRIPQIA